MIHCRSLGALELTVDGVSPPPELLWRKPLALLLYLLRSPRRTRTREHLAGLLWSDKPEATARHSLNEALRILRQSAEPGSIDTPGNQVRLAEQGFTIDVDDLAAAASSRAWARAAELAEGEFADGFGVPGANAFDDWLAHERRHWRGVSVAALAARASELLALELPEQALSFASRALVLDPVSEEAVHAALRSHLLVGSRQEALALGQRFVAYLREEVGTDPGPATRHLLDLAARGALTRHTPRRAAVPPERERLVGRGKELAALMEAWTATRIAGRPGLSLVQGQPGSGVTRLLQEVSLRAEVDGGAAVMLRAVHADGSDPFSLVEGAVMSGLAELPGTSAAAPAAMAALAARFPRWAERFPVPAAAGALSLEEALSDVLRAVGQERPLLLAIDDAGRLHRDSLQMIPRLLRAVSGTPVHVLVGTTSDASDPALEELRRVAGRDIPGVSVILDPLDAAALRELARAYLPAYGDEALDRVLRRVAADTAGSTLLAVEVLRAVARGLSLGDAGAAWPATSQTLDDTLPSELPDAVVAAMRINFRRLTPDAQAVLAAAAALPARSAANLLAAGAALDIARAVAGLDELETQGWLLSEGRGYDFAARLIRRMVAADLVTPGQRRRILERAGIREDRLPPVSGSV